MVIISEYSVSDHGRIDRSVIYLVGSNLRRWFPLDVPSDHSEFCLLLTGNAFSEEISEGRDVNDSEDLCLYLDVSNGLLTYLGVINDERNFKSR